jgi:hypothetical protein
MLINLNFCTLFELPARHFTEQQRTQILIAKKGYLGSHCIQSGHQLGRVLSLPFTKLTAEQGRLIWDDMLPTLEYMPDRELRYILSLPEPYLTLNQQKQVLTAMILGACQEFLNRPHLSASQTLGASAIQKAAKLAQLGNVELLREFLEKYANSVKAGDADSSKNWGQEFIRKCTDTLYEMEIIETQLESQDNTMAFRI